MKGILLLPFLLCITCLNAQNLVAPGVKMAVDSAIITNNELLNKKLEIEKSRIAFERVRGKQLPDISINALYTHTYQKGDIDIPSMKLPITGIELFEGDQSYRADFNIFNGGISATQILFSGFQITNGKRALNEKVLAEELMADASRETICLEVITTFDQLMLLDEAEKLILDTHKRLAMESEKVKRAISNGLAIPFDRDKLQLAMLELDARKSELDGNRQLLHQRLRQLTHCSDTTLSAIRYRLEQILLSDINTSPDNRKELQALTHSANAYDYLMKKEKGARYPAFFAFGNASYSNVFNSDFTFQDVGNLTDVHLTLNKFTSLPNILVGVGMKWTLFAGNELNHAHSMATIDRKMTENKRLDAEEKLQLLINKSVTEYNNTNDRLKICEQQVTVASNNKQLAARQYSEGLIGITDRLAAENDYIKASLGYTMMLAAQRKAAYELLHANGTLLSKITNEK